MNENLLPSSASPLERDLDESASRLGDVAVPIRDLWDADKAPANVLPWLAWALSIDFWSDGWSDRQKRAAIRQSWQLHRIKGTVAGARETVRLAGGRLVAATLPPSKTFMAPTWTADERRAWLSRYPELRVYDHRDRGARAGAHANGAAFNEAGKSYLGGGVLKGTAFPARGTAFARMAPLGFIVQPDGTERALTTVVEGYKTVTRMAVTRERGQRLQELRGEPTFRFGTSEFRGQGAMLTDPDAGDRTVGKMFPGGPRSFTSDKRARDRYYVTEFETVTSYGERTLARDTVQPSLDPIHVLARRGATQGRKRAPALGVCYPGRVPGASRATEFPADAYAGERMFRRTHLYDPEVTLERRGRSFHLGAMRLGMPAYHAELKVSMEGRRHFRQTSRHVNGFLVAHKGSAYERLYKSLRWAVPARDKVLINTRTHAPARAGGSILAGTVYAGEWQEA